MKTNILILEINIPCEVSLKRINSTNALSVLFHTPLKVGLNKYSCNHSNYAQINRMQCGLFQIISKETKK
jgi:hypothetical protein